MVPADYQPNNTPFPDFVSPMIPGKSENVIIAILDILTIVPVPCISPISKDEPYNVYQYDDNLLRLGLFFPKIKALAFIEAFTSSDASL